jgi:hypothetical protein
MIAGARGSRATCGGVLAPMPSNWSKPIVESGVIISQRRLPVSTAADRCPGEPNMDSAQFAGRPTSDALGIRPPRRERNGFDAHRHPSDRPGRFQFLCRFSRTRSQSSPARPARRRDRALGRPWHRDRSPRCSRARRSRACAHGASGVIHTAALVAGIRSDQSSEENVRVNVGGTDRGWAARDPRGDPRDNVLALSRPSMPVDEYLAAAPTLR